jgi:hypothetical protein
MPPSLQKSHAATNELAPSGPKKWYPSWPIPTDVPAPSFQVPGRRLFSEQDIERIVDVLRAREETPPAPRGD